MQHSADAAHPAQRTVSHDGLSNAQATADALEDIFLGDDIAQAYAADPYSANEAKAANLVFAQMLWWKEDCIVVPNSANAKKIILRSFTTAISTLVLNPLLDVLQC